ncbi:MAG: hypothetical protein CW338_02040 [Clostridiales bacterium]|nr:hypothetical protein [Clostridiales bacterium]
MTERERFHELAARSFARDIRLFTRFLDLNGQKEAAAAANGEGCRCEMYGGKDGCERKIACFYTLETPAETDWPLICLLAKPRSTRFSSRITHRDVLGSLMSLGLEREFIGDIIIREEGAYFFCIDKQAALIRESLTQIGGTDVDCTEASAPEGDVRVTRDIIVQVSSPRADAVIAHLFHLNRADTVTLIGRGLVSVDDAPLTKAEKLLTEGNVISVRGHGRAMISAVQSISKKGKINLLVKLYS